MGEEIDGLSLELRLYGAGADLSKSGWALRAPEGATAALEWVAAGASAVVHLALPDNSVAEARWAADQVLRKLRGSMGVKMVRLVAMEGVDDDTLLTIGLDLHHATKGAVSLPENAILEASLMRLAESEALYRRWVNEDPTIRTSLTIAADVESFGASRDDVSVEVMDEETLGSLGMNLLLAVGGGSEISPSRLVMATYTPEGSEERPWMLLGKGITFDSGGLNVKPYESFVSMMKNDMAGAALAFSLFKALVEGGWRRPLVLVIPTCENAVDALSMRPGALVKSYRGPTVRIDHTDAEGRLVLADGLAYASERFDPEQILCFATLTTAALIAYGPYATPVHFADDALEGALHSASVATGEDLHFFPRRMWHYEANRDEEGDLRNTARLPGHASRGAGSRNAGHFLLHFTDAPLCHLDIFASTWNWAGDAPGAGYGATGAPLRTLIRALEAI